MSIHDATSQRLFVEDPLSAGATLTISEAQAHYLVNVLRQKVGSTVLVFNGGDGEWAAELVAAKKRSAELAVVRQLRPQTDGPDIVYIFAPLKRARLDYMAQKATELGVAALQPVLTQRTIAERVNLERLRANAIEAAEQCGVLRVPDVRAPVKLEVLLANWHASRAMIFCDEGATGAKPHEQLARAPTGPLAVLVGPEGGCAPAEREALLGQPFVYRLSLGPRIMRSDTAGVAALALVNATLGDWR
ncbi:MAG: 16S rRNA (uracil(1498)-N(3))-methyltransferase [Hyphomicrobium sp.]